MTDPPERAPSSTLFVVDGAASTLLDRLVDEARGLSEAIVENDGDEELVARIEALWGAARPDVASAVPDLLAEFDRAVAMMDSAVARRRHADADKALNNLRHLIAALPPLE